MFKRPDFDKLEQWYDRLMSGEDTQGRGALYQTNGCKCCLGVLAVLHPSLDFDTGTEVEEVVEGGTVVCYPLAQTSEYREGRYYEMLPCTAWDELWGGYSSFVGQAAFWTMNDEDGRPFSYIAEELLRPHIDLARGMWDAAVKNATAVQS